MCACKLLISSLFGFLFYNSLLQSFLMFSFPACENNHCEETGVLFLGGFIVTFGNNKTSIFRTCGRLKYLGMTKGRKTENCFVPSSLSYVFFPKTNMGILVVQEFACREVHENSGDWVLFFASADELHSFIDVLQRLWLSMQQVEEECGCENGLWTAHM